MNREEVIETLRKFRWVDKYHTFHKIVPGVDHSTEHQKKVITDIVEECCTELIRIYSNKRKRVLKAAVRSVILSHMDEISYSDANTENKDFGYELCWYISEKVEVDLRKYTDTKVYGYWKVVDNKLKEVSRRSKKNVKKER